MKSPKLSIHIAQLQWGDLKILFSEHQLQLKYLLCSIIGYYWNKFVEENNLCGVINSCDFFIAVTGRQELIDRNILLAVSDEERRIDRSAIGAKLIRRLSLRPTQEELEERNILKSKDFLKASGSQTRGRDPFEGRQISKKGRQTLKVGKI